MKSISTTAIVTSLRSRVDRSIGLTIVTPEVTTDEKSLFFELQGINTRIEITPLDEKPEGVEKIDKDMETKTASQRLRSVLFLVWKQSKQEDTFESFYKSQMEKVIEHYKEKLHE